MLFPTASGIEDCGFVPNPILVRSGKLAQNCGFVEGLLHRRVAAAEPMLHQMSPLHGYQWIRRTTAFTLG